MGLNRQKGNMYGFVTHTWNTIKGECYHDCSYCYMKRFGKQKPVRLDKKELKTDLGKDNFIFVGSSCDIFNNKIPLEWINETLKHCDDFGNKYLFQSKNPKNFLKHNFPKNSILCTTIETNRANEKNFAPSVWERADALSEVVNFETMVTIEPIMDFDLKEMIELINLSEPNYVNIGARTGSIKVPEPTKEKIIELKQELLNFNLNIKNNLNRIINS